MIFPATHTLRFTALASTDFADIDLVVAARSSTEDRGHLPLWDDIAAANPERVAWITPHGRDSAVFSLAGLDQELTLSDENALTAIVRGRSVLIDMSGLPHSTWAPLFRAAHSARVNTRVLYAEPDRYKEHSSPISASRFDLSTTLEGLAPLPGFARLMGPPDESRCLFVAMLGFEGNRPECLALQIEPLPKVVPVVGVPGFQLEYPSFTVACNRRFLQEYRAHSDIRYARASCPFEAYKAIEEIRRDFNGYYLYLAPVGTKPHALGAVWYALDHPDDCEIMFDHPVRKPGRTSGIGVVHVYDFGVFEGGNV